MKNFLLSGFILFAAAFQSGAQHNISIFCDHVESISKQEGISFKEAADKVKQLGYNGLDVSVTISEQKLRILDSLGFKHASAIAHIDLARGENEEEFAQALAFMREHDYSRLLLVPGLLPENADENLVLSAYSRVVSFVRQAQNEGFDIMIEDYDNPRSICYNTQALDRFFEAVPSLNHVFDTGNYIFCGEDVMTALRHFRNRIHHVHLKDRAGVDNNSCPAVGAGIAPIKEVIMELLETGYDGWFTVEHYGSKEMLKDAEESIAYVNAVMKSSGERYR